MAQRGKTLVPMCITCNRISTDICSMATEFSPESTPRVLVRFVTMRFLPEAVPTFQQVFAESRDKIAAMPGCFGVQLMQDPTEPHCFFTWSEWTDADALDAYRHSPLFAATWARTKPLFRAKPTALSWYRQPLPG